MYSRTIRGRCHVWLHLPGRYINGCMNQYTHIVQSTCPKECLWFVVVGLLSVLHRFSPRFGYILLIVALPYSFIWCVQSSPFLFYSSHFCYFVHNVCTSAVVINIVTVTETSLSGLWGCDLRKGMEIDPHWAKTFVVGQSVGLERHLKTGPLCVVVPL